MKSVGYVGMCFGSALMAGALVGLNRECGKPNAMRAHAVLGLVAACVTLVASAVADTTWTGFIISGMVGGIGVLAAAVTMRAGDQGTLDLTSAASMWVTVALGIMCGLGALKHAALAAVVTQVVLTIGVPIERALHRRGTELQDEKAE